MHCNSERRIRETLERLSGEPGYREAFLERFERHTESDVGPFEDLWARFVELSKVDPYTAQRVQLSKRWRSKPWCREWVRTALDVCKLHDPEFSLLLEESITDRFELALAVLGEEGALA